MFERLSDVCVRGFSSVYDNFLVVGVTSFTSVFGSFSDV